MCNRLFVVLSVILFFTSCSKESENEVEIFIAGKSLTSIKHIEYNYVYPDQPATRTYTSTYSINNNKIDHITSSIFHYFHDDLTKNYTYQSESIFTYDNKNRLVNVALEGYSEFDMTTSFRTYEFDYYENDKIKNLLTKNENGTLLSKDHFVYDNNTIEKKHEYYEDGVMIFYNESIYQIDAEQRIFHITSKGPIFDNTTIISETTQEASFDGGGNVQQTSFDGSPSADYEYADIKIPSDLLNINLPFLGYVPYDIILAQFDSQVESYNTNYINAIIPLEPSNTINRIYKNTLSNDNYPLNIAIFYNDKIKSETTYTYE